MGEDGIYRAKKSQFYPKIGSQSIDESKEIDFGPIPENRPGTEFLKYHNALFAEKNEMKARAEPQPFPRNDTNITFNFETEEDTPDEFDELKRNWILDQRRMNCRTDLEVLDMIE